MIEFHGKCIPTTLEELVHPKNTALLIVDVQNDLCEKGGAWQKAGRRLSKGRTIIKKLRVLIEEARRVGIKIIYIQGTKLPGLMSDSAASLRFKMKLFGLDDPKRIPELSLKGSWGHQIVEEIKPRDGDLVVKKHRPSAFIGTDLDLILRSNDIKNLLVTGVVTEGCVDSTAKDALFHDYFVVVVRDCVDSLWKDLHDAAIKIMETLWFDVVGSGRIIKIWKKTCK